MRDGVLTTVTLMTRGVYLKRTETVQANASELLDAVAIKEQSTLANSAVLTRPVKPSIRIQTNFV
jgi:hypothetical protein